MKVDRVILALDNNPKYAEFWDITSYVWKNKFKIKPTLIFNGTQEELNKYNFNFDNCDYIVINKIPEVSEDSPDWSVTWSFFWGASQFPNDICMLCGIDQIPISNLFFDNISEITDDKFIIGFADAYKNYDKNTLGYYNTITNVLYPSSHLVGYGKNYKKIFDIDNDWKSEILKVYEKKNNYYLKNNFYPNKSWGLDECYASEKISKYSDNTIFIFLNFFWDFFHKRRLDMTNSKTTVDLDLVINGYYSEFTSKDIKNCKDIVNKIISNIKEY